ncbi:MAG: hypothetical protein QGI68_17380 [Pseudomonadales bacterium]|jgi:hypothetical protein|nr:hypothetical protein [Pseudomonadales bacterium]MDP7597317.1 hypothetical protein [Pseudomonadales bacterium]HJN49808.1 hypothetical protein [Pseudomonadales bacterium]
MHDLVDTEDVDAASERYWPDEFKQIIRTGVATTFAERVQAAEAFTSTYQARYAEHFDTYPEFVERLAEMVAMGAENGTDVQFEVIHNAFRDDAPFPEPRPYAYYLWPEPLDDDTKRALRQKICEEYQNVHVYEHIYETHYQEAMDFEGFVDRVAGLVVLGAINGADDMIGKLYRAILTESPLPPARRRPRRLR